MAVEFEQGTPLIMGFSMKSGMPLDTRAVISSMSTLETELPTNSRYVGQVVYVEDVAKLYVLKALPNDFKELGEKGDEGDSAYQIWLRTQGYVSGASMMSTDGVSAMSPMVRAASLPTEDDFMEWLKGKSAYTEAVDSAGFIGTEVQWLDSLKGRDGSSVTITGSVPDPGALPAPNAGNTGEGMLIGTDLWVSDGTRWTNVGPVRGPQGERGQQGPTGPKGDTGDSVYETYLSISGNANRTKADFLFDMRGMSAFEYWCTAMGKTPEGAGVFDEWMDTLKGKDGSSIRILGQYDTYNDLITAHPAGGDQGDCYLVAGNLYAFVGDSFVNMGNIQGPQGPQGLRGPTGPQGPKGEDGTSINVKGSVNSMSELPTSPSQGDAYIMNGDMLIWDGSSWANCGKIVGPTGPTGTFEGSYATDAEVNAMLTEAGI